MTCVQPSCKYQFCWECAGEYHTSTACSRPKVKIENNSVLAFDEFDRQCANHFLARKVALKGRQESLRLMEQTQSQEDAGLLRILTEGWSVLADAQSALAHSCIVMLNVRSAKLNFLFECQKQQAVALQQKFEESWTSLETFRGSVSEAKAAIRDLRLRLKDYLLTAHAEIVVERAKPKRSKNKVPPTPTAVGRSPARSGSTSASPSRKSSMTSSLGQKADSLGDSPVVAVSAADQPLFDWLQQRSGQPSLSRVFLAEVASTVFGDALGGSCRLYAPFSLSAWPDPHRDSVKTAGGEFPSRLNNAGSGPSSGVKGSAPVPVPVRALPSILIPLTFSAQRVSHSRLFPSVDDARRLSPRRDGEVEDSVGLDAVRPGRMRWNGEASADPDRESTSDDEEEELSETARQGSDSVKRPRK